MSNITLFKNLLFVATLACGVAALHCAGPPSSESAAEAPGVESSTATETTPAETEPTASPTPEAEEQALNFDPTKATGAVIGVPDPGNTGAFTAVANVYTELPGIDTSGLTPAQMERFLLRANSELCTCGCKDDTLARCYINDAKCPVVKGMLLKVLEEVKSGS